MQIGIVGINHKQAPLALRETIAKCCQRCFSLDNPLHNASFVLLCTCNRSELYFSSDDLSRTHEEILAILQEHIEEEFEQKLYTFFGFDCFLHMARVTAGLDSAIIAETEIQGQVRTAYEQACSLRLLSRDLHYLFQKSFKLAKEVRTRVLIPTQLPRLQLPGLEQALYHYAKEYFVQNLPRVLFIGASAINCKIARYFKQQGTLDMTFCNRSDAHELTQILGCKMLPWQSLSRLWQEYDWIIAATKSPHYILTQELVEPNRKRLLVDLAVPRNIDPQIVSQNVSNDVSNTVSNSASEPAKLLNIDDLQLLLEQRRALLAKKVQDGEAELFLAVKRQIALFRTRSIALPLAVS